MQMKITILKTSQTCTLTFLYKIFHKIIKREKYLFIKEFQLPAKMEAYIDTLCLLTEPKGQQ